MNAKPGHLASACRFTKSKCYECGKPGHLASACRFTKSKCYECGKPGHLSQVCRGGQKGKGLKKRNLQKLVCRLEEEEEEEEASIYHIDSKRKCSVGPMKIQIKFDYYSIYGGRCWCNHDLFHIYRGRCWCNHVLFHIYGGDTGVTMSVMAETTFNKLWSGRSLSTTDVRLWSYTKEPSIALGVTMMYHKRLLT